MAAVSPHVFWPRSKTATARVGCWSLAATQGREEWLPVRRGSHFTTRITEPGLQAPRHLSGIVSYRPNFGRSWPTPRLLKAAIYSGEAPTEGLLWLADLKEARPTDLQGSSEAVFCWGRQYRPESHASD